MQTGQLSDWLRNVREDGRVVILDPTGHPLEIDDISVSEETAVDPYDDETYVEAVVTITTTPKEEDA